MGAKFEIFLEVKDWIEPQTVCQIIADDTRILKITQIDNWSWENECRLPTDVCIRERIDANKIVILDLYHSRYGNIGISVELERKNYSYSLWFDTDQMEYLASNIVTRSNAAFYQQICRRFSDFILRTGIRYRFLAVGSEAVLESKSDMRETIFNSAGIAVWIVVGDAFSESFRGSYLVRSIPSIDGYLLEQSESVPIEE